MANTLRDENSIATTKLLSPSFYENFLVLPRTETRQAWNLAFRSGLRHREAFERFPREENYGENGATIFQPRTKERESAK